MFFIMVWDNAEWRMESAHVAAEEAECERIWRGTEDGLQRDIKRFSLGAC